MTRGRSEPAAKAFAEWNIKKILARSLFAFATLLLWITVMALCLELYEAFRWRSIGRNNRYLVAMQEGTPCPAPSLPAHAQNVVAASPSEPGPPFTPRPVLPEPSPREEWAWRAEFFATLNDEDRWRFALHYQVLTILFDCEGEVVRLYSAGEPPEIALASGKDKPLGGALADGDIRALRLAVSQVAANGQTAAYGAGEGGFSKGAFVFPMPGQPTMIGVFIADPPPGQDIPEESLWKIPFFVYRKHASRENGVFRTNNYGFRDDDVLVPKPPGLIRILCIGGSTTEEGDSNGITYPNILERRLNLLFESSEFDVVNAGLSGYSSLKGWMRMPDYLALEPDLLVWYNAVNDICHIHIPTWMNHAPWWQCLLRRSLFVTHHLNGWILPSEKQIREDLEDIFDNLDRVWEYAHRTGVDLAVCSFARPDIEHLPLEERHYYEHENAWDWGGRYITFETYCWLIDLFNERVRRFCKERGAVYIPVAENIQGGLYYFGDVCHMKNTGIALKAEIVLQHLRPYLRKKARAQIAGGT